MNALRENLVVENKIIGIFEQRKIQQYLGAEGAVPGVVFGELDSQEKILESSQEAVGDVFVERHTAAKRLASKVFSALYAGSTTATRLPLIMPCLRDEDAESWRWISQIHHSALACVSKPGKRRRIF